jgi:sulfite exporter TauE/SafE
MQGLSYNMGRVFAYIVLGFAAYGAWLVFKALLFRFGVCS